MIFCDIVLCVSDPLFPDCSSSLSHTLSLLLSLSHTFSLTHTHTQPHTVIQSHTQTHNLPLSLTHTLSLSLSLSPSPSPSLSLSLSHTCTYLHLYPDGGMLRGKVVGVIRRNWRQYAGSLDLGGSGDKEEG